MIFEGFLYHEVMEAIYLKFKINFTLKLITLLYITHQIANLNLITMSSDLISL